MKFKKLNAGENLWDLGIGIRSTIHAKKSWKFDLIKIENFALQKSDNKMKRQATEWKKILANYVFIKGLLSRIYKELSN